MPLDQNDRTKYKSLYIQTAREYVNDLMQNNPSFLENPKNIEILHKLHLASHSLKSQSILMGYNGIGNVTLLLEKIFKKQADNPQDYSDNEKQGITHAIEGLVAAVDSIDKTGNETDTTNISESLELISEKYM